MNYKPKPFYGNEGVVGLTMWIENMEFVFEISLCVEDCKMMFAACTFIYATLSWWNNHTKTIGVSATNSMPWGEIKQLLIDEYYP